MITKAFTRLAIGALALCALAFAGPGATLLQRNVLSINSPHVAADMGLTATQIASRDKLVSDFQGAREMIVNKMLTATDAEKDAYRDQIDQAEDKLELALLALLSPSQVNRLKQYGIQQEGLVALQDDAIARDLGLTAAQRAKMKTIYDSEMKAQDDYQSALGEALSKLPEPGEDHAALVAYEAKQKEIVRSMRPQENQFLAIKATGDKQILAILTPSPAST